MTHPHIRTFHARHGRISDRRKYILETTVSRCDIAQLDRPVDLRSLLARDYIIIDLGCGMGDHTVALATNLPHVGILAIDVHTSGICDIAGEIEANSWTYVAVHLGDGITVLRDWLAPSTVDEIHVMFPDPWPKAKHLKRRIIQPEFLDLAARNLTQGGWLHCVTDHDDYARHMQEVLDTDPRFQRMDVGFIAPDTSYHRRAKKLGHSIHVLSAQLG